MNSVSTDSSANESDSPSPKRKTYGNRRKTTSGSGSPSKSSPFSPNQTTSRYGRTLKPKISDDFYNTDVLLSPYPIDRALPLKKKTTPVKIEYLASVDDDDNTTRIINLDLSTEEERSDDEDTGISKIVKIVSDNCVGSPPSPVISKPVKTYTNRHKRSASLVESFGLPDYSPILNGSNEIYQEHHYAASLNKSDSSLKPLSSDLLLVNNDLESTSSSSSSLSSQSAMISDEPSPLKPRDKNTKNSPKRMTRRQSEQNNLKTPPKKTKNKTRLSPSSPKHTTRNENNPKTNKIKKESPVQKLNTKKNQISNLAVMKDTQNGPEVEEIEKPLILNNLTPKSDDLITTNKSMIASPENREILDSKNASNSYNSPEPLVDHSKIILTQDEVDLINDKKPSSSSSPIPIKNSTKTPIKIAFISDTVEEKLNGRIDDNRHTVPRAVKSRKSEPAAQRKKKKSKVKKTVLNNNREYTFELGELVWSQVGRTPYWPSLITGEPPGREIFTKLGGYGNRPMKCYHVNFFADNGRRNWIPEMHIYPYKSKEDVVENEEMLQYLKPRHPKWLQANEEAQSLLNLPAQDRFQEYQKLVDAAKTQKPKLDQKKIKENHPAAKRRQSLPENTHLLLPPAEKPKEPPVRHPPPEPELLLGLVDERVLTKQLKRNPAILNDLEPKINTPRHLRRRTESGLFQRPPKEEPLVADNVENVAKPAPPKRVPKPKAEPKPRIEYTSEKDKQKKVNLFKNVTKNRVCQICGKNDLVLKCKGPCFGLYHLECDSKVKTELLEKIKQRRDINSITFEADSPSEFSSVDSLTASASSSSTELSIIGSKSIITSLPLSAQEEFYAKLLEANNQEYEYVEEDSSDCKLSDEENKQTIAESRKIAATTKMVHVTADGPYPIEVDIDPNDLTKFKCAYCVLGEIPPCFVCGQDLPKHGDPTKHRCTTQKCGKYYHYDCLKQWPQAKWTIASIKNKSIENENLSCPIHNCHTCISDDPRAPSVRQNNEKLVKCIKCPTTYHASIYCIPAGTQVLSHYQIICPKHINDNKKKRDESRVLSCQWCFICTEGGHLVCCDACPQTFHPECLKIQKIPEDNYLCEECESGKLPLYDEIVWARLGTYRWWPAKILFPYEIPEGTLQNREYLVGEFVVQFFGTNDFSVLHRGCVFSFLDGDTQDHPSTVKDKRTKNYMKAVDEAIPAHRQYLAERIKRAMEAVNGMRPPPYTKIARNRAVGDARLQTADDTTRTNECHCDPTWDEPCGPNTNCINRMLSLECSPDVCKAGNRCMNQRFERREYADIVPFRTLGRGWGLKTLSALERGTFVIEYVGEVITETECQRRIQRKHEQKDENYYFLTIDKDRMIDAGPKGNDSRFMNHSCEPNCETQKWTVDGDTRVGLFTIEDIPADTELTFNYNLKCIGAEKKECRCGTANCSGYIGAKVKQLVVQDENKKRLSKKSKKQLKKMLRCQDGQCFICEKPDARLPCVRKVCGKFYHQECVNLSERPNLENWICPRHTCNFCPLITNFYCYKCTNAYCTTHLRNNLRYISEDKSYCIDHYNKDNELPSESSKFSSPVSSRSSTPGSLQTNPSGRTTRSRKSLQPAVAKHSDEKSDTDKKSLSSRRSVANNKKPHISDESSEDEMPLASLLNKSPPLKKPNDSSVEATAEKIIKAITEQIDDIIEISSELDTSSNKSVEEILPDDPLLITPKQSDDTEQDPAEEETDKKRKKLATSSDEIDGKSGEIKRIKIDEILTPANAQLGPINVSEVSPKIASVSVTEDNESDADVLAEKPRKKRLRKSSELNSSSIGKKKVIPERSKVAVSLNEADSGGVISTDDGVQSPTFKKAKIARDGYRKSVRLVSSSPTIRADSPFTTKAAVKHYEPTELARTVPKTSEATYKEELTKSVVNTISAATQPPTSSVSKELTVLHDDVTRTRPNNHEPSTIGDNTNLPRIKSPLPSRTPEPGRSEQPSTPRITGTPPKTSIPSSKKSRVSRTSPKTRITRNTRRMSEPCPSQTPRVKRTIPTMPEASTTDLKAPVSSLTTPVTVKKNKSGRPRKNSLPVSLEFTPETTPVTKKNKGGRPRKNSLPVPPGFTPETTPVTKKNKGGRPRKYALPVPPGFTTETPVVKKNKGGRPRKYPLPPVPSLSTPYRSSTPAPSLSSSVPVDEPQKKIIQPRIRGKFASFNSVPSSTVPISSSNAAAAASCSDHIPVSHIRVVLDKNVDLDNQCALLKVRESK